MHTFFRFILASFIHGFLGVQLASAATYYVSPSGADTNSGTSTSAPARTIRGGLSKATASGDIVYVMAGTYVEAVSIGQSGITLSAYQNDKPVIDGQGSFPSGDWGSLISVNGNYNKVSGFEIKNSNINGNRVGGYGMAIMGHHNTVSRMNVHHTWSSGVISHGDNNIVEDSTVWQSNQQNAANPGIAWGSGLSAARNRSSAALIYGITSNVILRRNKVFNNWGEGISCYEADHCTIEDNITYDNYAVNLYLSDATNSLVQRNIVYVSSSPAILMRNHPGLTLADEVSSAPRSANNVVINNFIYNTNLQGFSWTIVPNSGLRNVLIANNTIVNGNLSIGSGGASSITNSNSQIRNNIVIGTGSVPNSSGVTFSNNNWTTVPAAAASSSNVSGDPRVARIGSTAPGALTAEYFKLLEGSPMINRAMPLSAVGVDFFRQNRTTSPDIGGHEFASAAVPAPTPAPTPVITPTPAPAITPTPAPASSINLALNRPVKVSSTQASDSRGSYYGSYAVDGKLSTRWSSKFTNAQWIFVDLGAKKQINRVVLNWETAYGKSYSIQVSDDSLNWKTIYYTTTGNGGVDDLTGLSGAGRYVRMLGITRGTQWGYSLYELRVYGN